MADILDKQKGNFASSVEDIEDNKGEQLCELIELNSTTHYANVSFIETEYSKCSKYVEVVEISWNLDIKLHRGIVASKF